MADPAMFLGLMDELRKVAASRTRMTVPQSRSGRRPISVDKMLRKDQEGTLFKNWHDKIPGGLADKRKPEDFDPHALAKGWGVEREHTNDVKLSIEIAMDHLTEDPQYYDKLEKMEGGEKRAGVGIHDGVPAEDRKQIVRGAVGSAAGTAGTIGLSHLVGSVGNSYLKDNGPRAEELTRRLTELSPVPVRHDLGISGFIPGVNPQVSLGGGGHRTPAVLSHEIGHAQIYGNRLGKILQNPVTTIMGSQASVPGMLAGYASGRGTDNEKVKRLARWSPALLAAPQLLYEAGASGLGVRNMLRAGATRREALGALKQLAPALGSYVANAGTGVAGSTLVQGIASATRHRSEELGEKKAYRLQGHTALQGLSIAIENRKGSVRSGEDPDGTPWRTKYKYPYGYIVGTEGNDGEEIDAYIGPDKKAPNAFVVHQHKLDGTGFDEDKVIFGVHSVEEAKKLYLEHYNKVGKKLLGPISTLKVDELKRRLEERRKHTKLAATDFQNPTLPTDRADLLQTSRPKLFPDKDEQSTESKLARVLKRSYVSGGSGSGITGNRMAMLDMDEKPDATKPGDVPSRDGTNPGAARISKYESGPDMVSTLPTNGAQANSQTGATTRL